MTLHFVRLVLMMLFVGSSVICSAPLRFCAATEIDDDQHGTSKKEQSAELSITQLIKLLDDDEFRKRHMATQALVERGNKSLSEIDRVFLKSSPEAQQRLFSVLKQLALLSAAAGRPKATEEVIVVIRNIEKSDSSYAGSVQKLTHAVDMASIDAAIKKAIDPHQLNALRKIRACAESGSDILEISDKGLTELPPEIAILKKNLKRLRLSSNQFTELPPEIGELKNLTSIHLVNNRLTKLPSEIGELENLQELLLGYNKLTELPPEMGKLKNLKSLHLLNNQLTEVPTEMGELKNLRKLFLHGNKITKDEFARLKKALPMCDFLEASELAARFHSVKQGSAHHFLVGADCCELAGNSFTQQLRRCEASWHRM